MIITGLILFITFGFGWTIGVYIEKRKQRKRSIPILYRKLFNEDKI